MLLTVAAPLRPMQNFRPQQVPPPRPMYNAPNLPNFRKQEPIFTNHYTAIRRAFDNANSQFSQPMPRPPMPAMIQPPQSVFMPNYMKTGSSSGGSSYAYVSWSQGANQPQSSVSNFQIFLTPKRNQPQLTHTQLYVFFLYSLYLSDMYGPQHNQQVADLMNNQNRNMNKQMTDKPANSVSSSAAHILSPHSAPFIPLQVLQNFYRL